MNSSKENPGVVKLIKMLHSENKLLLSNYLMHVKRVLWFLAKIAIFENSQT
jgi:hypothetical protein